MEAFSISAWHWIVRDDASRAWSSAAGAWVADYPSERVTRIGSEAELRAVLRQHGMRGPGADAIDVKAEAQRRIVTLVGAPSVEAAIIRQLNALMRAVEITNKTAAGVDLTASEQAEAAALASLAVAIQRVRSRSDEIEALDPIPDDYTHDRHWL